MVHGMSRHLRLIRAFGGAVAASVIDRFTWDAMLERRRQRREATVVGIVFMACLLPFGYALSIHEENAAEAKRAAGRELGRASAAVEAARRSGTLTLAGVMDLAERCEGRSYYEYPKCVAPSGVFRRDDGRFQWRGPREPGAEPGDYVFQIRMKNEVVAAVTPFEAAPAGGLSVASERIPSATDPR